MDIFTALMANLLSPPVLFFILGLSAGFLRSDLDVPESISRYLALYLMMSIGFKGGTALSAVPQVDATMIQTMVAGLIFSAGTPFLAFVILKTFTNLDKPTAAAVSAHYGSVSLVTYVTAVAFLEQRSIPYGGHMAAVLALMEAPAILTGLYLAHRTAPETVEAGARTSHRLSREIFTNGAILLLMGSFIIGALTGKSGADRMAGFLVVPFQGVLSLFLLDMGLLIGRQRNDIKALGARLVAFALAMPMIGAFGAILVVTVLGLDVGTATLFIVLAASASYIAVPAAMRLALPQAKAAVYLPLSLGVTFPFNVVAGVPLYYTLANRVLS